MPETRQFVPLDRLKPRLKPEAKKAPEFYATKLTAMMAEIAKQYNREVEAEYGLKGLLNSDNTLNMASYAGDIYEAEDIQDDNTRIHEMEQYFSRAALPQVQAFYRDKYGAKNEEEIINSWRRDKIKSKSGQMEMAVTGLLHKLLKGDYLVVRASTFDDYNNGVDNIIINKETGEVICAFDEVHEGGAGERTDDKIKKVKKVAAKGGARVRYGIKLEEGKLKRAEMTHVPVFYLGLKSAELDELLNGMDYNPDGKVTKAEYSAFTKLIASLKEQMQILNGTDASPIIRNKLESFEALIEDFEARVAGMVA